MSANDRKRKKLTKGALPQWRQALNQSGKRLVVTNGCFDLLHVGHIELLETAKAQGDALLVGVSGDISVRTLKGASRPLNHEEDRAAVIAALECVDAVYVFPEVRAVNFLEMARPDIYVKGGDYSLEALPQEERDVVEQHGGKIILLAHVPGHSTTEVVRKIRQVEE